MLNQVILVGTVSNIDATLSKIDLTISNTTQGVTVTTKVPVYLGKIAKYASQYLSLDVVVGIKARLENGTDGIKVVAEKMTFINKGDSNE